MSDPVSIVLDEGPLGPALGSRVAGAGAVVSFEGVVRPLEGDRPLSALVYEAYEPMTSRELRRLAEATLAEHSLLAIGVEHSVGRVAVGECSFRLTVAGRHRAEALRAADQFIARMKRDVPLWKTPVFKGEAGQSTDQP